MDEFSKDRKLLLENWNIKKVDEFSGNQSKSDPVKVKFRKNIWMNFPEIAHKS